MSLLLLDLRHALRLMRRQPAFAIFATLTLGVGIGAATAVFTLVHAVLLHALPFADPDRLVWMYNARTERARAPFSIPDLEDYARDATTLAGLAPFTNWTANLTGTGDAERLEGTRVAGNFFQLLGAPAMLGRALEPRDESGRARVAVLTHGLWKRRFGRDAAMVGRQVVLNGAAYVVVGVMPEGFVFPFRASEIAVPLTLQEDPRRTDRGANFLRVVARLKPDATIAQATADLDTIAARLQQRFPDDDARKTGVNLYPLHAEIVTDYRQILWALFAAVGVLLAIGCGNLANLMLVRVAGRRAELALRVSLGASRGRIARQFLAEAVTLSALGGVLGVAVATAAIALWRAFGPAAFPRMNDVTVDIRVLAFAGTATLAAAVISGLVPAWAASRDVQAALGSETRSLTATRRHGLVRRAFVVLQVAASVVLLVCTGLLAKGFGRLEQVDPGFARDHALSVQLSLPPARYPTRESISRFYEALRVRLAGIPEVREAGAVSLLPLSGLLNTMDVSFPDRPAPPHDEVPQAHFRIASAGYFAAAGIRILSGRAFLDADDAGGRSVAIVSRTFAERHWPGQPAVGKPLRVASSATALEIIGVVNDVKQFTLDGAPTADLYLPLHQMPPSQASLLTARMYWVMRTRADPRLLESAVRTAIHAVDRDVATSSMLTLDDVLLASLGARRVSVRLLELFGQVAIALAAMGVYAIAAFSAGARKRELAIRSAFGATGRDLVRMILVDEMRPALAGVAVGMPLALGCAPLLRDMLFAVSPADPFTYIAVAGALLAVSMVASYLPARRAGRVDPVELLRT